MSSTNKHDSDKDDEIEQCRVVPDEKYKKWNSNIGSGNKFARRARSFKEDLLDIISSAMRSPSHSAISSRSGSPKNGLPKQRHASSGSSPKRSLNDIDFNVRQVQIALRHFLDVVTKNKLEMLPGNGTVVLETVTTICGVFKSYDINEQSSLVVSALNQVYQSVAQLIKLCDDVLIFGEKAINTDNVSDILRLVELAIQNLVSLTNDKLNHGVLKTVYKDEDSLKLPDELKQRVSLPDIPLTPREREILEQTSNHSFDTVDCNPPSKPPLPDRTWLKKTDQNNSPPPLPPKRRTGHNNTKHALCNLSLEPLSLSDRSSSIGSLDSILNDDEVNIAMSNDDSSFLTNDTNHVCGYCNCSSSSASVDQGNEKRISPFSEYPPQHTMVEKKTAFIHQASNQVWTHSKSTTIHQITNRTVVSNEINCLTTNDEIPPPVPEKKRIVRQRLRSTYDNLSMDEMATQYNFHRNNSHCSIQALTHTASLDNPAVDPSNPPPLPLKKKHIMAYMEMFGNCTHGNTTEFLRHSVHTYTMLHQSNWHSPQKYQSEIQSYSVENSCQQYYFTNDSDPPALPPKRGKIMTSPYRELTPPNTPNKVYITEVISTPIQTQCLEIQDVTPSITEQPLQTDISEVNIMEELNVSQWLLFKKPEEDGPLVRGGHADALVVHATNAVKNDFMYQEAFLTTYRTFISPLELIQKLCMRHQRFQNSGDLNRQRAGRESFSLLVRVVSDLTLTDLDNEVLQILMEFVYQLLCAGDLTMAKALRVKLLERYQAKLVHNTSINALLPSQNIYTRQATLLDYKTELIAEQMTMLDSELFMKIEIPEVLIWVKEQNEERSPNLTEFTEHFNKMSYWARSRILEQNDAKERERYVLKFIKIMKSLRKMNNFNSYLALLSALDSAPIRRLEWQKYITEGLKEYCALIDSSSSFRAYRQALADTNPPCIPYIGLVLQDLTFVHIGNNDYISDNIINFSKRWQQFNIVENMKRFKKGCYNFKKHDHIIAFFNNFDEFLCEEAMWQISESIKPRGKRSDEESVRDQSQRNRDQRYSVRGQSQQTLSCDSVTFKTDSTEYVDEICPYATFELTKQPQGESTFSGNIYSGPYHSVRGSFVKRQHLNNIILFKKEPEYTKVRQKGRKLRDPHSESQESDNLDSTDSEVKRILTLHLPISEYDTHGSDSDYGETNQSASQELVSFRHRMSREVSNEGTSSSSENSITEVRKPSIVPPLRKPKSKSQVFTKRSLKNNSGFSSHNDEINFSERLNPPARFSDSRPMRQNEGNEYEHRPKISSHQRRSPRRLTQETSFQIDV